MSETLAPAMVPYAAALEAFYSGDTECELLVRRDDGFEARLAVRHFFRQEAGFSPIDRHSVEQCQGRVLDVGAGVGAHSMALQARGLLVTALDVSAVATRIMRVRGVGDARCGDVYGFGGEVYDTVLLMGHGIGMAGDLAGLDRFLDHIRTLVRKNGSLILDSLDVTRNSDPTHLAYHQANRRAGRYVGETRIQFEFAGEKGPFCAWLHVDPGTLGRHAQSRGWTCEVLLEEASGEYLARLGLPGQPLTGRRWG